ncbi:hypothetical protein BAT02nite_09680 [Bacillus atrophaeus]|nr:hypothetical protein BAT02nite_09680 [Bacillus atrophaeus]
MLQEWIVCVILSTPGEETQFLSKFFCSACLYIQVSIIFDNDDGDRKKRKGAGFVKKVFFT